MVVWRYYASKSKWDLNKINKNFEKDGYFILELPNTNDMSDFIYRKSLVNLYCDGIKLYRGEIIHVSKNDFLHTSCIYLKRPSNIIDIKNKVDIVAYVKFNMKYEDVNTEKIKYFKGFQAQ